MEELVSIIIPVYNAEKYLNVCLDSVLSQTYRNIEIICINDGSSDNSLSMLREYEEKDSRVKVIDKMNSGVSAARNDGIRAAHGSWIAFVDADDWIDVETIEKAVLKANNTGAVVVMWAYTSERENKSSVKCVFTRDMVFCKEEIREKIHRRFVGLINEELSHPELSDSLCTVWGKLYKASLINKISFTDLDEIGTYEDGLFNLEAFGCVFSAAYISKPLYHYRRTNAESQTKPYNPKLARQWETLFDRMRNYISYNKLGEDYSLALNNRISMSILGLTLNIIKSNYKTIVKVKMIKELLSRDLYRNALSTLQFRWFPIHWKLYYFFAKHEFSLGIYLLGVVIMLLIR